MSEKLLWQVRTLTERIRRFDACAENEFRCEICPHAKKNHGRDEYPCGQYRCWVTVTNMRDEA